MIWLFLGRNVYIYPKSFYFPNIRKMIFLLVDVFQVGSLLYVFLLPYILIFLMRFCFPIPNPLLLQKEIPMGIYVDPVFRLLPWFICRYGLLHNSNLIEVFYLLVFDDDQYDFIYFFVLKLSAGGTISQLVGGVHVSHSSDQVENCSHLRLNFGCFLQIRNQK